MQGLFLRIGLIYRENAGQSKKSFSIQYFFVDDDGKIHLVVNLPRLQKILRTSSSIGQIVKAMTKNGQKSLNLDKYFIGDIKLLQNDGVLPFTNRSYVEIKEKQTGKQLNLIPIVQDEIQRFQLLLKNRGEMKNPKLQYHYNELKKKETAIYAGMFELCKKSEHDLKIETEVVKGMNLEESEKHVLELNPDLHYLGPIVNGLPQGQGKQVLVREGISYNGRFQGGKKNGPGYLVNSNLDTMYCQFANDELTGI